MTELNSTAPAIGVCKEGVSVSRAEYLARAQNPKHSFKCEHCGKESRRKLSGTSGSPNRWCSMLCRKAAAAVVRQHAIKPPYSFVYFGFCGICKISFTSKRKRMRCSSSCDVIYGKQVREPQAKDKRREQHKKNARSIVCAQCECKFSPLYGSGKVTLCVPCSEHRRWVDKQIQRLKRSAMQRGATVEAVNPFKVFDRDRWRCRLCNVKTPKSKRGTYADDAPELDHIIPLSKGGQHSYINTQCACRKCNALKSDRPMGQLLLIG